MTPSPVHVEDVLTLAELPEGRCGAASRYARLSSPRAIVHPWSLVVFGTALRDGRRLRTTFARPGPRRPHFGSSFMRPPPYRLVHSSSRRGAGPDLSASQGGHPFPPGVGPERVRDVVVDARLSASDVGSSSSIAGSAAARLVVSAMECRVVSWRICLRVAVESGREMPSGVTKRSSSSTRAARYGHRARWRDAGRDGRNPPPLPPSRRRVEPRPVHRRAADVVDRTPCGRLRAHLLAREPGARRAGRHTGSGEIDRCIG